jgi:isopentenyl phosphate kinase
MKIILIKIGGSLITKKSYSKPVMNWQNLRRIAKELSYITKMKDYSFIIVHGAGSYGHPLVEQNKIHKGIKKPSQRLDMAHTQLVQHKLTINFAKELIKNSIPAFPLQASAIALMEDKKLKDLSIGPIRGLVNNKIFPVLGGVPAYDLAQVCSILSGDDVMVYLAKHLNAEMMLFATDVDGIYDRDPNLYRDARLIRHYKKASAVLGYSLNPDVTGGMKEKVNKVLESRVRTLIFNGNSPYNLIKALKGKDVGTRIN